MDLERALRPGRPRKTQEEVVRALTEADLALLATRPVAARPPPLAKLRESHHALARALASGARNTEAAAMTGYNVNTVNLLMGDPSFQELVALYRGEVQAAFGDMAVKMAAVGQDLLEEYHDRLQSNPESFDLDQLESGIKTMADRIGYGPQSRQTNVNVNVNLADRLEAARRRADAARPVKIEEVE